MELPASLITFFPPISSPSSILKLMAISSNAERGFCDACGSTLTFKYHATPETLYVAIASVDDDIGLGETEILEGLSKKHIYEGEKVHWYKLPDDVMPRFETMPNESKYLIFGD